MTQCVWAQWPQSVISCSSSCSTVFPRVAVWVCEHREAESNILGPTKHRSLCVGFNLSHTQWTNTLPLVYKQSPQPQWADCLPSMLSARVFSPRSPGKTEKWGGLFRHFCLCDAAVEAEKNMMWRETANPVTCSLTEIYWMTSSWEMYGD